ncbi:MAG TPA: nickel-dependent lactate racemase [Bryobacteraceae bacterium]|nr:nickel-dependent lactate racemase [Bryobacteraceae bacterium]
MPRILKLAFGKQGTEIELPDGFEYVVLDAKSAVSLDDQIGAIEHALEHPIGTPPLTELAHGKKSAAISVCDITRPAPNRKVLPPVLRRLEAAGIARQNIVILIATGLHRPATPAEIREIVGEEVARDYRVENHDARELSQHRYLGTSAAGTPAYIDERFAGADLRLSLGFIEPHLMAGYSGGRKLVVPGLAAQETIKVIHSPRFMREPLAVEGSIEENPLHRELVEIAGMAGHQFIVDVALSRDRGIAAVFAGNPVQAHRKGVEFVSHVLLQKLKEPVDAVITTGAGYPLDLTYYQCIKGITAASHVVRNGGRILVVGACSEGCGGPEFSRLLGEYRDPGEFLKAIEGTPVTVDQWQLEKLALVATRAHVFYCVPGLAEDLRASLWGPAFDRVDEAVAATLAGLPAGSRVAVIPEGPYILAKVLAQAA